ncbi:MAG: DUF5320 domain-containing protein [Phycisphaerae bacterium]|nr:DUF5320 domain-containing protein [Phycisphaerae bacterium]
MPRGDRTGPAGMGPMTGRGAGSCAGYQVPGYANPVAGGGMGYGLGGGGRGRGGGGGGGGGGGWGRRNMFHATGVPGWGRSNAGTPAYAGGIPNSEPYGAASTREQELDMLKGQADYFEGALNDIQKRISDLEAASKEK